MTTEPPAAPPTSPDAAAEKRRKRLASYTFRNMVLSVLGVLVVALVWWSITYQPDQPQARPVQVPAVADWAGSQASWPVWVGEPKGWTPTVVWYDTFEERPTWHMSLVTADRHYVAIHQAADVTPAWLGAALKGATRDGEVTLTGPDGQQNTWERWRGPTDSNAQLGYLLGPKETGGSTVVLHGTGTQAEFESFLASVRPRD